jgi:hypothetical protein
MGGQAQHRPASEAQPNQLGVNATTRQRVIKHRERERNPRNTRTRELPSMEHGINYGSDDCYLVIHMTDITKTAHQMYNTYLEKLI